MRFATEICAAYAISAGAVFLAIIPMISDSAKTTQVDEIVSVFLDC